MNRKLSDLEKQAQVGVIVDVDVAIYTQHDWEPTNNHQQSPQ